MVINTMQWVAIAIGGACGALSRYWVTAWLYPVMGNRFPLATLAINVLGSFLIGLCYVAIVKNGLLENSPARHLLMVGFLGAFTTFSTFALETVALLQNGQLSTALLYMTVSVVASVGAVFIAFFLGQQLF